MSLRWRSRKRRALRGDLTGRKSLSRHVGRQSRRLFRSRRQIHLVAGSLDGSLAVGTGDNGKLYRVRAAGANPESSLLINTNQTHVMSLAVTKQGDLIAGTDPGGLVLRISPDGKALGCTMRHCARFTR